LHQAGRQGRQLLVSDHLSFWLLFTDTTSRQHCFEKYIYCDKEVKTTAVLACTLTENFLYFMPRAMWKNIKNGFKLQDFHRSRTSQLRISSRFNLPSF